MACPKCGCKTVYQFDDEEDPQDDRLQRCAACGEVFDLDDHAEEEELFLISTNALSSPARFSASD